MSNHTISKYRVELKNSEQILYESENVPFSELSSLIEKYLSHPDIHSGYIISDAVNSGVSACWCGTIGLGYKIAKHTDCNSHIKYVFENEG